MRKHSLAAAIQLTIRADAGEGAQRRSFLRVTARANAPAEVMIYGVIGESIWPGTVSARDLADQIAAIQSDTIHVRVNSEGGVVPDALSIYTALRNHSARKVGFIDGQAASMAGCLLMACDEVVAYPTSLFMIHAPSTVAAGNATDFREFANSLDTHAGVMAEAYVAKTGKPDEIAALLSSGQDHWYTGREAAEFGFADRVEEFTAATTASLGDGARVVALNTSLAALRNAPTPITACLRGHITTALSPTVFASLSEVSQQAVIGHIEDPSMKDRYLRIVAEAGAPSAAAPAAAAPAAPAAPVTAVAPAAVDTSAAVSAAATNAITALRNRNAEIRAMATPHMGNPQVAEYINGVIDAADPAVTADVAGRQVLALLAQGGAPIAGNITAIAGGDQADLRRAAMINAIEARAGLATAQGDNPYRGHSLSELARECVTATGARTAGMDKMEIVGLAFTHSSSDFPGLLGDTARKAVRKGYQEVEDRVGEFTSDVSVPDFKPTTLVGLGAFSNLLIVPEGGEYKYGTFSEQSQKLTLATYGRLFSITRQAIINDDLGIFNEVPRKMGRAARRTIVEAVWNLLVSNPVLDDGHALFSEAHGNLLAAAGISTESVDKMRVAMGKQKDQDGQIIRVPMKSLLTPLALGGLARTVRDSQNEVGGSKNLTVPNSVKGTFDVLDDAHLDDDSATAWYGAADPNYVDGLVIAYLNGNKTPYLEQHEGFTVDGVAWKVRLDAKAGVADYRGLYKNPGA